MKEDAVIGTLLFMGLLLIFFATLVVQHVDSTYREMQCADRCPEGWKYTDNTCACGASTKGGDQ